ncbi:MAG: hypothetical protein DMG07_09825 [Acidobacteria bacterium]|nr:MAG: hypothetical protein DMG07_09825 [Acidobacteriota bacterium]
MKNLLRLTALVLLAAAFAPAGAQSLGDLAKKEKERREKLNSETKVITSLDADKYKSGAVTTGTPAPSPAGEKPAAEKTGAAKAPAEGAKSNPDEPTDFQGRPESFWRQALGDTRARVKELENEANVLVLRLNDLQNQFYRESDGYKQQSLQRETNKSFYEQDQNKVNLAKARAALDDLEKEGRKSGALPGWLRP